MNKRMVVTVNSKATHTFQIQSSWFYKFHYFYLLKMQIC